MMGNTPYEVEQRRSQRLAREREAQEAAEELAQQVIDLINKVVIRLGPKPEERECTQVAGDIEALRPQIIDLILE
jgi:hypothetical protein